jgi:hypothetical protein
VKRKAILRRLIGFKNEIFKNGGFKDKIYKLKIIKTEYGKN